MSITNVKHSESINIKEKVNPLVDIFLPQLHASTEIKSDEIVGE